MYKYPQFIDGKKVLSTQDSDMLMDIAIYEMQKGEEREFFLPQDELAILLVYGDITLKYEDEERRVVRGSFLHEAPTCLHLSKGKKVTITANAFSEVLSQATNNDRDFATKFYNTDDCDQFVSCDGRWENTAVRDVLTIFDYNNAPYSNMVIGEVHARQGRWWGYIPHDHAQPEVYYYKFERPEGFGACFIGDDVYKITEGSVALIEGGKTHPQVTAPGYPMYNVWMIRHLDNNPWTDRIDDPRYTWLMKEEN